MQHKVGDLVLHIEKPYNIFSYFIIIRIRTYQSKPDIQITIKDLNSNRTWQILDSFFIKTSIKDPWYNLSQEQLNES